MDAIKKNQMRLNNEHAFKEIVWQDHMGMLYTDQVCSYCGEYANSVGPKCGGRRSWKSE